MARKIMFSTSQKHAPGKRRCTFCANQTDYIDYKDYGTLKLFIDFMKRIKSSYYTGVCLRHQKELARSIKRARFMALVPFIQ